MITLFEWVISNETEVYGNYAFQKPSVSLTKINPVNTCMGFYIVV
jgi:hypothetical protein